jgi:RNA polymerase sigma factor (TIGR02999 family)
MDPSNITVLLNAASSGDPVAVEELFRTVYAELRKLAHGHRKRWSGDDTLNTTALIHEAYLKLAGSDTPQYQNRSHFYATASKAMRHILINYAEQQKAAKRGGDVVHVPFEEAALVTETTADELLHVESVLSLIEKDNPRQCRIIECRVFGGMSIEETATALGISPATVKREWQIVSTQMYEKLRPLIS